MSAQSFILGATALIAGGLLPCARTAPLKRMQQPMLEFTVIAAAETARDVAPAIRSASQEAVEVTGAMATPNPCYEISARLAPEGGKLTLTLTAIATGGFCAQVVAAFEYRARITGLDAGTYELVTLHTYPETGWEQKAFRLQLNVPRAAH